MAFITVSTGVGAGLVLAETLHVGPSGLSGHAGHMLSDPNGPMCGCGRKGCVESIASGTAIAAAGKAFGEMNVQDNRSINILLMEIETQQILLTVPQKYCEFNCRSHYFS